MRYYYAYRHGGGAPVDFLRFKDARSRDRWVNAGWGRLPWRANKKLPEGLEWQAEEVFWGGDEEPLEIESTPARP